MIARQTFSAIGRDARRLAWIHRALRGFSILEVLFAVIILGIGFIMVAAMFPVAIHQTRANVDESIGRGVVDSALYESGAVLRMLSAASDKAAVAGTTTTAHEYELMSKLPGTIGDVPTLLRTMRLQDDQPAYCWDLLYNAEYDTVTGADALRMIVVGLVARTTSEFELAHLAWDTGVPRVGFYPCTAELELIPGSPTQITFSDARAQQIAVEGALVVRKQGGAIYRLGGPTDLSGGVWELSPESDAVPSSDDGDTVDIFIVGRGLRDPGSGWDASTNPHEGPSQVVAVRKLATTFD